MLHVYLTVKLLALRPVMAPPITALYSALIKSLKCLYQVNMFLFPLLREGATRSASFPMVEMELLCCGNKERRFSLMLWVRLIDGLLSWLGDEPSKAFFLSFFPAGLFGWNSSPLSCLLPPVSFLPWAVLPTWMEWSCRNKFVGWMHRRWQ